MLSDVVIKNVTNNIIEFHTFIATGKLCDLTTTFNNHLLPTILWYKVCNEYFHTLEDYPIDINF